MRLTDYKKEAPSPGLPIEASLRADSFKCRAEASSAFIPCGSKMGKTSGWAKTISHYFHVVETSTFVDVDVGESKHKPGCFRSGRISSIHSRDTLNPVSPKVPIVMNTPQRIEH